MTTRLVALALRCLMVTGTAMAEQAKVMITVEHAPGGSSPVHRHNAHAMVYVLEGSVVMQVKGPPSVMKAKAPEAVALPGLSWLRSPPLPSAARPSRGPR